jgi:hypothetical protein
MRLRTLQKRGYTGPDYAAGSGMGSLLDCRQSVSNPAFFGSWRLPVGRKPSYVRIAGYSPGTRNLLTLFLLFDHSGNSISDLSCFRVVR